MHFQLLGGSEFNLTLALTGEAGDFSYSSTPVLLHHEFSRNRKQQRQPPRKNPLIQHSPQHPYPSPSSPTTGQIFSPPGSYERTRCHCLWLLSESSYRLLSAFDLTVLICYFLGIATTNVHTSSLSAFDLSKH